MDLTYASIGQLGRLLQRRAISATEITRHSLDRLATVGTAHGAVAELLEERALAAARRADRMLAEGRATPLTGIPFGVKDLLDIEGATTRWGSTAYPARSAGATAPLIRRLEAAGAILVAQLSMMELAGAGGYRYATASATGVCLNPWDRRRWSGGSSSGSAAAVAAGCVPFSIGSETGGSILIPAAFCGVTGVRPTFGAVSREGSLVVAWTLDKLGPITRSAADADLVMRWIAGEEAADPLTWGPPLSPPMRRRPRIGVLPFLGDAGDERTRSVFDDAIGTLRAAGYAITDVPLPEHDYRGIYERLHTTETAHALRDFIATTGPTRVVDPAQAAGLAAYRDVAPLDYAEATQDRILATRAFRALFRDVDVLVAPTLLSEATMLEDDLRTWPARRRHYAVVGAVTGIPGVTVPMGFGERGLPLGLSVMTDVGHDRTALAVARRYQQVTDWHRRVPADVAAG